MVSLFSSLLIKRTENKKDAKHCADGQKSTEIKSFAREIAVLLQKSQPDYVRIMNVFQTCIYRG